MNKEGILEAFEELYHKVKNGQTDVYGFLFFVKKIFGWL